MVSVSTSTDSIVSLTSSLPLNGLSKGGANAEGSHQTKTHTTNVLCPWFLCRFIGSVLTAVTVMLSRGKAPVWSFNEIEALKNRIYCYNRRQPDCDLISSGYFVTLFSSSCETNYCLISSGYFVIRLFRHPPTRQFSSGYFADEIARCTLYHSSTLLAVADVSFKLLYVFGWVIYQRI